MVVGDCGCFVGGAVLAREAAEEGLDEVVDEAGEDARGFGGIEALDLVPPPFAADLVEGCLEAAGDELFVEAWGTCGGHGLLGLIVEANFGTWYLGVSSL